MKVSPADIRYGGAIDPNAIVGYLRAHGWTQVSELRRDNLPVVLSMTKDSAETQVPLLADARDFGWLAARLVNLVADVEDRPAHQVLADLRQFRTDVVRLRRVGRDDASLPLGDGAALFSTAQNLMVATAMATINEPKATYSGRRPNRVITFMQEVLLGQTEPGSFVVRVLVPLPPQVGVAQTNLALPDVGSPKVEPFGRRVTMALSTALEGTRRALVTSLVSDTLEPFRDTIDAGVSAEFCRALSTAQGETPSGGLEVSVSWGLSAPRPAVEPVFFQHADLAVLRQAADYLAETQIREDFELEGYITQLERDPDAIQGDITIAANVDGKLRKVLVGLRPELYKLACRAHVEDLKVTVVGELGKDGRQFRLIHPRHLHVVPADDGAE